VLSAATGNSNPFVANLKFEADFGATITGNVVEGNYIGTDKTVTVALTSLSTAGGDLRIFPAGTALPLVSAINYNAGKTRANNAIIARRLRRHDGPLRPAERHGPHDPRRRRVLPVRERPLS
jgi:hypothetical protein